MAQAAGHPAPPFELGLYSFAEITPDPATGRVMGPAQRLRELIEEAELADQVGLDVFGVGEHHRADFAVTAPAVALAAIATRTRRIRLTSAATVLSSDDPVRVFEEFTTVDLLSEGRAEIMAGRGSYIESFPLFGYPLADYDALFEEKLELLLALRDRPRVTWAGRHRAPLNDVALEPRPLQTPLPVWVAVGGTPASVARAARLGLPLAIAILAGDPERFAPLVGFYRDRARTAGHDAAALPVAICTPGFVADNARRAAEEFYPSYAETMTRLGRERGWPPMTREQFDAMCTPRGALVVGSPGQAIEKILHLQQRIGHRRHLLQLSVGTLPHAQVMRAIEWLGTEVAPVVRQEIAARVPATGPC
jgi:probable LLM family oxidoreductase